MFTQKRGSKAWREHFTASPRGQASDEDEAMRRKREVVAQRELMLSMGLQSLEAMVGLAHPMPRLA